MGCHCALLAFPPRGQLGRGLCRLCRAGEGLRAEASAAAAVDPMADGYAPCILARFPRCLCVKLATVKA